MKRMSALVLLLMLALPAQALADGLEGCIVNQTPRGIAGTVTSTDAGGESYPFMVRSGETTCFKVDDGSYAAESSDSIYRKTFTASWRTRIRHGGADLYWLVTFR